MKQLFGQYRAVNRVCIVLALVLGLVVAAAAQIQDSPTWIFNDSLRDSVRDLQRDLSCPFPPMEKSIGLVIIRIRGLDCRIIMLGPKSSDAKQYARAIEDWKVKEGFTGVVEYSQESDCAAASFAITNQRPFSLHGEFVFPVRSLAERLDKLETRVLIVLRATAETKMNWHAVPDMETGKGRFWLITDWHQFPNVITAEVNVSPFAVPLVALWIACVVVGIIVLTNPFSASVGPSLPTNPPGATPTVMHPRRTLALFVLSLTILVVSFSPTHGALGYLWLGKDMRLLLAVGLPFSIFIIVCSVLLFAKVKLGLNFKTSGDEKALNEKWRAKREIQFCYPKYEISVYVLAIIWLTLSLGIHEFTSKYSIWYAASEVTAWMTIIFLMILVAYKDSYSRSYGTPAEFPAEFERFQKLALPLENRLGLQPNKVVVQKIDPQECLRKEYLPSITLGLENLRAFSESELQFLIAKELARLEMGDRYSGIALPLLQHTVSALALFFAMLLSALNPYLLLLGLLVTILGVWLPYLAKLARVVEAQDIALVRRAIQITGDRHAAESVLNKYYQSRWRRYSWLFRTWNATDLRKRLDAIQSEPRESGI